MTADTIAYVHCDACAVAGRGLSVLRPVDQPCARCGDTRAPGTSNLSGAFRSPWSRVKTDAGTTYLHCRFGEIGDPRAFAGATFEHIDRAYAPSRRVEALDALKQERAA
jgi:hypothetical protein